MSNQPQILGTEESPESGVRTRDERRFMSDSGVYAKLAEAIASFGKEDEDECDDEAVTLVRLPAPQRPKASQAVTPARNPIFHVSPASVQQPIDVSPVTEAPQQFPTQAASGYQVALELSRDDLSRIWAEERAALVGRAFVWSEQAQAWTVMHDGHEVLQDARAPLSRGGSEAHRAGWTVLSPMRDVLAVNLLRPTNWAFACIGAAAACLIIFGLSRGAGQPAHGASEVTLNDVVVTAGAARTSTAPATSVAAKGFDSAAARARAESADIIPVTSLPLVSDSKKTRAYDMEPIPVSALPLGAAQSVVVVPSADSNAAAAASAFNTTRARQVLDYASRRVQQCTGASELSGSAVVTFAPSGAVNDVTVQSIAGDVSKMSCVVSAFHAVRVPAFTGTSVSVKKSFGARG